MCLTPACVHAASEILYNLSPDYENLDPCNNFNERTPSKLSDCTTLEWMLTPLQLSAMAGDPGMTCGPTKAR